MSKQRDIPTAVQDLIRPKSSFMVSGFGRGGVPFTTLEHIAAQADTLKNFTVYKNDANEPGLGIGMLLANGQVDKLYSTHIGLNPDFIAQMNAGDVECELIPQGIFVEKIRAGGAGLPAFLSDIGLGTIYADNKETIELDGKTYLLERAFRADVALLCADVVDELGNCWWKGSNRNTAIAMGMACNKTLVEAKKIVPAGTLEPENVHLPSGFVDVIVQAEKRRHQEGEIL